MSRICGRGNEVKVHWVSGHKDIEGNELVDLQTNEAASEVRVTDVPILPVLDKTEAITELKKENDKQMETQILVLREAY